MTAIVSNKQRAEWEDELKRDYPNINTWILKILLDTYCAENGKCTIDQIVKNNIREERKKPQQKKAEVKKEMEVFQGEVTQWDETWEKKVNEINERVNAKVVEVSHGGAPSLEVKNNNVNTIIEECSPQVN